MPSTLLNKLIGKQDGPELVKAADAAARYLKDAPAVSASVVRKQMLENFPASALGWVKTIRWAGPVEIPVALLDFANAKEWAANHQEAHVDDIAAKIKAGEKVNPVIGIIKPGHNHIRIPDGRHRSEAYRKLGLPAVAYVGFAKAGGKHPSDRVYLYQEHSGSDPANKSADPGEGLRAAGIAVRAKDTGRVLMLQRRLQDDKEASGKWEFPGGRLDDGEAPLEAAMREWREETGMAWPAGGKITGSWNSSDGKYRGYVLTIPREEGMDIAEDRDAHENPDDPDRMREPIAWFDLDLLKDNPSVRDEILEDRKRIKDALDGKHDAHKSAETPRLEATPDLLGTHGLWHTPDRHVHTPQKLPNYIEHIAHALMRDQGMDESQAIATAINAVKRWARGDLHWGRRKIHPEVIAASQRALAEWEHLKETHH